MKAGSRQSTVANALANEESLFSTAKRILNSFYPEWSISDNLRNLYNATRNNVPSEVDWRAGETTILNLDNKIYTRQTSINREGLLEYIRSGKIRSPGPLAKNTFPNITKIGDRYFIEDGNHRMLAAKLLGKKSIKVQLTDLTQYAPKG